MRLELKLDQNSGVTEESEFPFEKMPFDGILGLGLPGLSAAPSFNALHGLKRSRLRHQQPVEAKGQVGGSSDGGIVYVTSA